MCMVSGIYDYGKTIPEDKWTLPGVYRFQELIDIAKEVDSETGQPDCEDPEKAKFLKRLKKLEKRLKKDLEDVKKIKEEAESLS